MHASITENVSVSSSHFLAHMAGAVDVGLDLEPIYQSCGVSSKVLEDPDGRIPYALLTKVRMEICRVLDDESEGFLQRSAPWGSTVFMCRAIVSSTTLREALLRYCRFSAILNEEDEVALHETAGDAIIRFRFANRKKLDCRTEIINRIFFLLSFSMWLTDKRFAPRRIALEYPPPSFADEFSHLVPCPYLFDQDENALILDGDLLRERVRKSPRSLNEFLANHHAYLLSESLAMSTVADAVRRLVKASIRMNASLQSVSSALRIPQTTLRRRLKSEGTSFQQIKDEIRMTRAHQLLSVKGLTVSETSELCGFSDPAVFSRAFKNWTGQPPSLVKKEIEKF